MWGREGEVEDGSRVVRKDGVEAYSIEEFPPSLSSQCREGFDFLMSLHARTYSDTSTPTSACTSAVVNVQASHILPAVTITLSLESCMPAREARCPRRVCNFVTLTLLLAISNYVATRNNVQSRPCPKSLKKRFTTPFLVTHDSRKPVHYYLQPLLLPLTSQMGR